MSKPIPVTFLKAWQGYSEGEVAGFDQAKAQALIDKGFAKAYAAGGKAAAKPKSEAPAAAQAAAPAAAPAPADEAADDEKP